MQIVEAKVPTTTLPKFKFALSMDPFDLEPRAETRKLRHHALLPNEFGVKFGFVFTVVGGSKSMFGDLFSQGMFISWKTNTTP